MSVVYREHKYYVFAGIPLCTRLPICGGFWDVPLKVCLKPAGCLAYPPRMDDPGNGCLGEGVHLTRIATRPTAGRLINADAESVSPNVITDVGALSIYVEPDAARLAGR